MAAYLVDIQTDKDDKALKVYPYDVKINDWNISANFANGTYSKLEFDIFDSVDALMGSTTRGFTGTNRLQSGENSILLNATSEKLSFPIHIKVYEVFTNENGETAKRPLTAFQQ